MKHKIILTIGDCYASNKPTVISTILGSCIAVCLYVPPKRIGGMNHIFLPGKVRLNDFGAPSRYSSDAIELLVKRVIQGGANYYNLRAKVFGGAHLFSDINNANGIGEKIATEVLEFLHAKKIRIISMNLGGHEGRKIHFHTDTEDAFLKRFSKDIPSTYLLTSHI